MAKKSKKIQDALKKVDSSKVYPVAEAVALTKEVNIAKFDAMVKVVYRLNIDPKKADQQVRSTVVLSSGTNKTQTVLVFAEGDRAKGAEAAGADFVGDGNMVQRIQNGWFDFDVIVATPDMMATVGRLRRVLGPKGLMPNPRTGTATMDVAKTVNEMKAGKATYRVDKAGGTHVPIGKVSLGGERLVENLAAIHDILLKAKPSATKGQCMKNIAIIATFGPGIHIDQASFQLNIRMLIDPTGK